MSQWNTFDTIPVKEMFFETEAEANKIILNLFDIVEKYGFVSVADYYDLCGASWENDICSKYGWNILAGMRTVRAEDKEFFTILLPSPRPRVSYRTSNKISLAISFEKRSRRS